jgi:hypothetical protein
MPNLSTSQSGNGNSWSPPRPSASQYNLTGLADGFRGAADAANQLSRQLSQGARSPECGPTGVLGDLWQSLQRGTLGPDLIRWGLNEYRTNPLWQRQFTEAELRQLTIDLAKRGEFEITKLLHQIVDEKGLQHWLTGQVDYAVQALRDPRTAIVMGFNLGVGLVATGIGAATLPAIAAVAVGSLVANVAFQTWVESGGGLNFNLEAFRSSLGINSAATVPGLIGGLIGSRFGAAGRYIGAAIGSGLGQIVTNAIQGRPWDEGLLFNMGLSIGMEGVMAGVERWAGGGAHVQAVQAEDLAIERARQIDSQTDLVHAQTDDTVGNRAKLKPGREFPDFTQEMWNHLLETEQGRALVGELPLGSELPRIEYSNIAEASGRLGEYYAYENVLVLDEGFVRSEEPRLASASLAHELSHRSRRWWTDSIYEEYRAHYIQQQVGQELGIRPEMATTEFARKVVQKHFELTKAVEAEASQWMGHRPTGQVTLWEFVIERYERPGKITPPYGRNLWNDPDTGDYIREKWGH